MVICIVSGCSFQQTVTDTAPHYTGSLNGNGFFGCDAAMSADSAVAVAVGDGSSDSVFNLWSYHSAAPIDSLGNFTLNPDTTKSLNWIVLLTAATSDRARRVVGCASLAVSGSYLSFFSTRWLTYSRLPLGSLTDAVTTGESPATLSTALLDSVFLITAADRAQLAGIDDPVIGLSALYANMRGGDTTYQPLIEVTWTRPLSGINGMFDDPNGSLASVNPVYRLGCRTRAHPFDESAYRNKLTLLTITPPGPVDVYFKTDSLYRQVTSVSTNDLFTLEASYNTQMYFWFGSYTGLVPQGWWRVSYPAGDLFVFNVAQSLAIGTDGRPRMVVPACRITTAADSTIRSVDIVWYAYAAGTYVELTGVTVLQAVIRSLKMSIQSAVKGYNNLPAYNQISGLALTDTQNRDFAYTWTVGAETATRHTIGQLKIEFTAYGNKYCFSWKNQ